MAKVNTVYMPSNLNLVEIAEEMDRQYRNGWRYIGSFPAGNGSMLVFEAAVLPNFQK